MKMKIEDIGSMKFEAKQFRDGKYMSSEHKALLANTFVEFVESGFANLFWDKNPSLYKWLMCSFGFSPLKSIWSFYSAHFSSPREIVETLKQIQTDRQTTRPDSAGGEGDINRVIQQYVEDSGLLETYQARLNQLERQKELELMDALIQKFPIEASQSLTKALCQSAIGFYGSQD